MAKAEGRVARRYARALFELCPAAALEQMRAALRELAQLWEQQHDFRLALTNPAIPHAQRAAVLGEVCARVKAGDAVFKNFTMLLLENGRLALLPEAVRNLSVMIDQLRKVLALEIVSAFELPAEEKSALEERVKSEFGGAASVSWSTDRALMGGLLIKSGDRLLDSSVRSSLDKIRAQLRG